MCAERQAPEVEKEVHPTVAQEPEVSESAEALLTPSQTLVASELAEAPLPLAQSPEGDQPAPEPIPAGGPGALCANWSGLHTTLREVPPGALLSCLLPQQLPLFPAWGGLWPRFTRENSWPWPARGRVPGLT
jgi:hypothetical protein